MSVYELTLSSRTHTCLSRADIHTIGQLIVKKDHELLKYRNFGKKCLAEVKTELAKFGLDLGLQVGGGLSPQQKLDAALTELERVETLLNEAHAANRRLRWLIDSIVNDIEAGREVIQADVEKELEEIKP